MADIGKPELPATVAMTKSGHRQYIHARFEVVSISRDFVTLHNPAWQKGATSRWRLSDGFKAGSGDWATLEWWIDKPDLAELQILARIVPASSRKHHVKPH